MLSKFNSLIGLSKVSRHFGETRATYMIGRISHLLERGVRILDIGSGTCHVCKLLLCEGFEVTPLDVQDKCQVAEIRPQIYSGTTLPFSNKQFDVALLLTVLHHTSHPEIILKEANRVARWVIVMEDVYRNTPHKYLTFFVDSLLNLEFVGHPHSNKSDLEWRDTFEHLGFELLYTNQSRFLTFTHAVYHLRQAPKNRKTRD